MINPKQDKQWVTSQVYRERYFLNELMKGLQARHCRKHLEYYLKRMNIMDTLVTERRTRSA
ncbi:MAG: hypothetical protein O6761_06875 [Thaumarchaeota archaeon]|nr:hypothetical protein [Nitrososphaerota archaeon]